jgi:hypothetical protein
VVLHLGLWLAELDPWSKNGHGEALEKKLRMRRRITAKESSTMNRSCNCGPFKTSI